MEKISIGVRISKDLYNQLRQYCITAGRRPGALLDEFIKDGLAKLQPQRKNRPTKAHAPEPKQVEEKPEAEEKKEEDKEPTGKKGRFRKE